MSRGVEGVELARGVEVSSWCRGLVSRCRGQGSDGDLRARGRQGSRAAARAHRGFSLDGEWGERESSQARVTVMRDDIDSWSRPRLAERLKVVGLRAHVAGARPQQTRRGDDDGEEHHGGEERPGAAWARSSFRSGQSRILFLARSGRLRREKRVARAG